MVEHLFNFIDWRILGIDHCHFELIQFASYHCVIVARMHVAQLMQFVEKRIVEGGGIQADMIPRKRV